MSQCAATQEIGAAGFIMVAVEQIRNLDVGALNVGEDRLYEGVPRPRVATSDSGQPHPCCATAQRE